jgi:hypothetical protein
MNRPSTDSAGDEMRPEYDFSGAVRGMHHLKYRESMPPKLDVAGESKPGNDGDADAADPDPDNDEK